MCGIAGIWFRDGERVRDAALHLMGESLRHRGPDSGHVVVRDSVGLAHRRLRIMDLSDEADQPMASPDGRVWLTYNGEIHNFVELRDALGREGVRFRTQGDTEVVLQAYLTWGLDCFRRFNGMWALAIRDEAQDRLILSRDRFGIKPLYYSIRGSRLVFASEPKAVLAAFPEERVADRQELLAYLSGAAPDATDATYFVGIRSLPPGRYAIVTRDAFRTESYWDYVPGREQPVDDAAEQFRALLSDAVRIRLRSDVPVGVCLSGGLDSSAITRLAAQQCETSRLQCFSVKCDESYYDESRYAAAVADDPARYDIHWVRPSPDRLLEVIDRIVWHHDAPTPYRGRYGQWITFDVASRNVRVVLDGHGADELLGGYDRFLFPYVLDLLRMPPPGCRGRVVTAWREMNDLRPVAGPSYRYLLRQIPPPLLLQRGILPHRFGRMLNADFRAEGDVPANRFFNAWLRPDIERPYRSHLNNALWREFTTVGLPEALHSVDALSMAFSLETRTPFLDHRLVEFMFGLPYHQKMGDGYTKNLLRRALARDLPADVLRRRNKMGFVTPMRLWFRRPEVIKSIREILLDPACLGRGLFHPRHLEQALEDYERLPLRRTADLFEPIWRCLSAEIWIRRFIEEKI